MIRYYDPLYRHTLPERRIEVVVDDVDRDLAQVKAAIGQVLGTPRDGNLRTNEGAGD
jgi:tRNA 2-selenouridine synthase